MITLTKTFEFAASHRLWRDAWSEEKNRAVFGKCANGHGHNYRMEVCVTGPIDPETGMVINADRLQDIVKEHVLSVVDHKDLDKDVPWFKNRISTVESLVDVIWDELAVVFVRSELKVKLHRVTIWETGRVFATRETDDKSVL